MWRFKKLHLQIRLAMETMENILRELGLSHCAGDFLVNKVRTRSEIINSPSLLIISVKFSLVTQQSNSCKASLIWKGNCLEDIRCQKLLYVCVHFRVLWVIAGDDFPSSNIIFDSVEQPCKGFPWKGFPERNRLWKYLSHSCNVRTRQCELRKIFCIQQWY